MLSPAGPKVLDLHPLQWHRAVLPRGYLVGSQRCHLYLWGHGFHWTTTVKWFEGYGYVIEKKCELKWESFSFFLFFSGLQQMHTPFPQLLPCWNRDLFQSNQNFHFGCSLLCIAKCKTFPNNDFGANFTHQIQLEYYYPSGPPETFGGLVASSKGIPQLLVDSEIVPPLSNYLLNL